MSSTVSVLVLGASGLIGNHVLSSLRLAGINAIGASRRRPEHETTDSWLELHFAAFVASDAWLTVLKDIDVVINCVGITREHQVGDFDVLHRIVPCALFSACEKIGVKQVIQISALGSAVDADTPYWRSKGAADSDLLQRSLIATVVRPSLVYGDEGASSRVFRQLATFPLVAFPLAHRAKVQPIHAQDLADTIVNLVQQPELAPRELAAVGPIEMTIAEYIHCLRHGMAAPAGRVVELPLYVARPIAAIASVVSNSPLTLDSLVMLAKSEDGSNTADPRAVRSVLGRPLREPNAFANTAQYPRAVLTWLLPFARFVIAGLWLWTAFVSWFIWPHESSAAWLIRCGIPADWATPVLAMASIVDSLIGLRLLWRPPSWLWPAQLLLIAAYTVAMSLGLPEFWWHPFGPLSKNLPIMVLIFLLWRFHERKR